MGFHQEPTGYTKTIFSDLQGAWGNLREMIVEQIPFPDYERLLFHVDEGMSWESVRDLKNMRKVLLLVRNIATQSNAPEEIREQIDEVWSLFEEAFEEYGER